MFYDLLKQFDRNISGLREFVDLIQPMLNEYHLNERKKHDESLLPLVIARQIQHEENPEKKIELEEKLKEIFDGEIEVNIEETDADADADAETETSEEKSKKITYKVSGNIKKLDEAFEFTIKSESQKSLLYVNSLISLLSSSEWFYSQILHFFYDKNPNSAGIKKRTLTLEELQSFGSVEDAEKYLIDSKIENLLRSSFSDWIDTLKSELNLGLGYIKDFQEELIEIYQRRNLLVHNGGVVNSIYLAKVGKTDTIEIGDKLSVDEEYLENAINKIHVIFSLIACELWKKDKPEDEDRANFLMDLSYSYLKRAKWNEAQLPNIFLKQDGKIPIIPRTYAQLNIWLCMKRLDKEKELNSELEQIDYSDKTIVIQLALSALKENKEDFFDNLPRAINSEELPVKYLFEFPILKEMRETEEYKKFIAENEKVIEYLETQENNS